MENPISFRSSILEAVQSVQSQKRSSSPFALANPFSPQSPTPSFINRFSGTFSASSVSHSPNSHSNPHQSQSSSQYCHSTASPLSEKSNSRHSFILPTPPPEENNQYGQQQQQNTHDSRRHSRRHSRKQSDLFASNSTKTVPSRSNSTKVAATSQTVHPGITRSSTVPVAGHTRNPRHSAASSVYSSNRSSLNLDEEAAHYDRFPIKVQTTPIIPTRSTRSSQQYQRTHQEIINPERRVSHRSFSDKTITPRNVVAHSKEFSPLDTEYEELVNSISARKGSRYSQRRSRMSLETVSSTPSAMARSLSASSDESRSKSPGGSKLGAFFGWASSTPPPPQPPPKDIHLKRRSTTSKLLPSALDIPLANADHAIGPRSDSGIDMRPLTPGVDGDIEDELRTISSDLASSIGRELELEELVEKLQMQLESSGTLSAQNRRTSDYFSDAGTSANAYSLDQETSKAEVDYGRIIRKGEQEKAQLRLEMVQKVQEERDKRKQMVGQLRQMESQLEKVNYAQIMSAEAPARIRELEYTVEDLKRKLREERKLKANFEDLFTASRDELEHLRNERDNLKDEIIPQLQAQLDGYENENAGNNGLMYENSRMQQEIEQLRAQNATLTEAHRQILEMRQQGERSLQQTSSPTSAQNMPFKDKDSWLEKLKAIEDQRDALQMSTRNLRMRLTSEMSKAEKKIQSLEEERDNGSVKSPRRLKKDAELLKLRKELDQLRSRADDALAAKDTYEQGLDSLRLDLEKAEQETSVLRALLKDKDNLLQEADQLKKANRQLSMQLNIERDTPSETLKQAMDELKEAAARAQQERDEAIGEAEAQRRRANSIEQEHMAEELNLSSQLQTSAVRVEELAAQVREQLQSNNALRMRLKSAIQRGEQDQLNANTKLNSLQGKIKGIEEKVIMAQQQVDDADAERDREKRELKETKNTQLRRMKGSLAPAPRTVGFKSPLPSPGIPRSPLMEMASSRALGTEDGMRSTILENRVTQLEQALGEADNEVEDVVSRLNKSQIEVADLRTQRDEALQQTRKLQALVEAQRAKYTNWMN